MPGTENTDSVKSNHRRCRHGVFVFAAIGGLVLVVAVLLPYLPGGPDTYVHLLWTQQVMTCLRQGSFPLWLPDLNAGFGTPGIRLYSPAGPFVAGLLGLLLGDAGRGMRLLAAGSLIVLFLLAKDRLGDKGSLWAFLLVANPIVPFLVLYRGAFSELYALPLAYWLLSPIQPKGNPSFLPALGWALLWLTHGPTFIMVSCLSFLAVLGQRSLKGLGQWFQTWALGLAIVAWHWLPLLQEQDLVEGPARLTAGIFDYRRNFLGFSQAHDTLAVARLSWLACSWSLVLLLSMPRLRPSGFLAIGCFFLASPLSYPFWLVLPPLALLQFPWRFLTPASLLLPALAGSLASAWKRLLSLLLMLLPYLWLPLLPLHPDPKLQGQESWQTLGQKVHTTLAANPFVVDAEQNRPPAFSFLADNILVFGSNFVLYPGTCHVQSWKPTRKEIQVEGLGGRIRFRLLAYPFWRAKVDGQPVDVHSYRGTVALWLGEGKHHVVVFWAGNKQTLLGWVMALGAFLLLAWDQCRRGKPSGYAPPRPSAGNVAGWPQPSSET